MSHASGSSPPTDRPDHDRRRWWERPAAVLLGAFYLGECWLLGFLGALGIGMAGGDGCHHGSGCNDVLINAGLVLAVPGQLVAIGIVAFWMFRRARSSRPYWYVPVLATPLPVVLWFLGSSLADAGIT